METMQKPSRKQQILESLAHELERSPGERITTAGLARAVGVSEAALYRHFASKAKMFEALIAFAEDSVFSRINRIMEEEKSTLTRCAKVLYLQLMFAERNPGITRVLLGDALVGETERLQTRVDQFFSRLETQFKQILRESEMRDGIRLSISLDAASTLLVSLVEGRMHQYLRTHFKRSPVAGWEEHWQLLEHSLFHS
ncbi:MAG: nucleoid occlusion factor SlmA [Chromatiales bacterium]|jgi:TetR/AcrR family transcriptional regulator